MNCTKRFKSKKVQDMQKKFWMTYFQEQMKKGGLEDHAYHNFNKGFKKSFMESCKNRKKRQTLKNKR
jgi:hypothetical protein